MSSCSIAEFPAELLREIFVLSTTKQPRLQPRPRRASVLLASLILETDDTFDASAITISQVCGHWRAVSLDFAELWATMRVYSPSLVALERIELYLRRSGTSTPLTLELSQSTHSKYYLNIGQVLQPPARDTQEVEREVKYTEAILALWSDHMERWRSIYLDFQSSPPPLTLINVSAARLPLLRDVAIHYGTRQTSHNQAMFEIFWNTVHTLPTLRTTYWEYGHIPSAPFRQLTKFTLRQSFLYEIYEILSQCHQLQDLTIQEYLFRESGTTFGPQERVPLDLPYLNSLSIKNQGDSRQTQFLLGKIIVPTLEVLEIRNIPRDFPKGTLANFLAQSRCSLRSLVLGELSSNGCVLKNVRIAEQASHLDSLEKLAVIGSFSPSILRLLNVRYRSTTSSSQALACTSWNIDMSMLSYSLHVPFPSLATLKVDSCSFPKDGVIGQMLLDRAKAGSTLSRLDCNLWACRYRFPDGKLPWQRKKDAKLIKRFEEEFGSSNINVIHDF